MHQHIFTPLVHNTLRRVVRTKLVVDVQQFTTNCGNFFPVTQCKTKDAVTSTERSYDMSSLYLRQKNRPKAGLWTRMKIVSSVVSCGPSTRIVQFSRISRINLVWGPYGSRTILTRARILERLCYHTLVAISDIVLVIAVLRWSVKIW